MDMEQYDRDEELRRLRRKLREMVKTLTDAQDITTNCDHQLTDANVKLIRNFVKEILPKVREIEFICLLSEYE